MITIKIIKKTKPLLLTLSIILILFISISAISATNTTTDTNQTITNQTNLQLSNQNPLTSNEPAGTFTDLNTDLNGQTGTISLTKDYTYNPETDTNYINGISLSNGLTINGNGHTINGNGTSKAFNLTTGTITINNLTFTNCKSASNAYDAGYGGVIVTKNSVVLNIVNCTFVNNSAYMNGGAICIRNNGILNITDSTFINNSAKGGSSDYGGVIFLKTGNMTVNKCIFINNSASSESSTAGGGALAIHGGNMTVNNSYFYNNSALNDKNGGAIFASNQQSNSPKVINLTIYNSTFKENFAQGLGGAIFLNNAGLYGYLNLYNSTLTNNSAHWGGAIYVPKGDVYIDGSKINYNNASQGGAIFIKVTSTLNIVNSTLIGNNASTGVITLITAPKANFINSTFINNTAEEGGVLYDYDSIITVDVNGSNFINNIATKEGACFYVLCNGFNVNNSNFTSNKASKEGGVLYNIKTHDDDDNLTLSYSNFINNTASCGASIYTGYSHFTNITHCNFIGNNVKDEASVMYFDYSNIVNVSCSNFIKNNADNGSGTIEMNEGELNVANSTFVNNTAYLGGAIDTVKTNVTIIYSVFIGNEADFGGAIASNKSLNVSYSVFYDNYAPSRGDAIYIYYGTPTKLSLDYNWWGYNDPFNGENYSYFIYNRVNSSYIPWNNWVVMTLNASADTVYRYTPIKFDVTLNKYFNSTDNSTKPLKDSLPARTVYFEGDGFNPSQSLINGEVSSIYTSPDYYDVFDLGATIDGETLLVSVENVVYETEIVETELVTFVNGTVEVHVIDDVGDDVTTGTLNLFYDNRAIGTSYVRNGTATFNIDLVPGNYTVLAFYFPKNPYVEASQYVNLTVLSSEEYYSTILTANDLTKNFGDLANFTGNLVNAAGLPLSDEVVSLNLTRLSSGASKVYNVTTDEYGDYYLPINLAVGEYTIQAFFEGDGEFESSVSSLANVIVNPKPADGTYFIVSNFTEYYGAVANFTGQLLDNVTDEPVIGQHIALNLTRLSSGASRVYWATTDINGEFQLPINLSVGDYTIECCYAGTSLYESSIADATITVNPL